MGNRLAKPFGEDTGTTWPCRAAAATPWQTRFAAGLALALIGGCASAPAVRWHSLLTSADGSSTAAAAPVGNAIGAAAGAPAAAPVQVDLDIVRVPVEVAQPQWLVRLPDETLRLLEEERWAAPLRDELRAALMQALTERWGATDARSRPAEPTTDAIRDALPSGAPPTALAAVAQLPRPAEPAAPRAAGVPPAAVPLAANAALPLRRVTVDVTRFESLPDREARLDAVWTVTPVAARPTVRAAESPSGVLVCRSVLREPVATGAPALAAGHRRAVAALADAIGRALPGGPAAVCPPDKPR